MNILLGRVSKLFHKGPDNKYFRDIAGHVISVASVKSALMVMPKASIDSM